MSSMHFLHICTLFFSLDICVCPSILRVIFTIIIPTFQNLRKIKSTPVGVLILNTI